MRRSSSNSYGETGLIPGAHEKAKPNDSSCPYLELVQVPLAEKAQPYRENPSEGIRQVGSVSSVEGVPAFDEKAGGTDKGGATVYQKHRSSQSRNALYDGRRLLTAGT